MANSGGFGLGAKLMTGSIVSLLLSIGFCGSGFTVQGATAFQQFEVAAGLVLLVASFLLLVAAIVAWLSAKP